MYLSNRLVNWKIRPIWPIDILIIDRAAKALYSLECKAMSPSRNIREMSGERTKLFGFPPNKGWVGKHMERQAWLEQHLAQTGKVHGIDLEGYTVRSFFVTLESLFATHILEQLPLSFITLYDFAKKGMRVLTAD